MFFCINYRGKIFLKNKSSIISNWYALKLVQNTVFEFDAIDIDDDHLHLFACAEPKDSPPRVKQIIKNMTARKMFNNTLKSKKIFGSELWSKGGYIGT